MHDKYTMQELWNIVLNQPLIEAEKRHKEELKKRRKINDKNIIRKTNK